MYCKHCGKEIVDNATFCPHCGQQVQQTAQETTPYVNQGNTYQQAPIQVQEGFSTGVKVWMIICIIANFYTALQYFIISSNEASYLVVNQSTIVLLEIICIANAISYLLLMLKQLKVAFFAIVAINVIALVINFSVGVGATAVFGLLNPLITYAAINKYWQNMK